MRLPTPTDSHPPAATPVRGSALQAEGHSHSSASSPTKDLRPRSLTPSLLPPICPTRQTLKSSSFPVDFTLHSPSPNSAFLVRQDSVTNGGRSLPQLSLTSAPKRNSLSEWLTITTEAARSTIRRPKTNLDPPLPREWGKPSPTLDTVAEQAKTPDTEINSAVPSNSFKEELELQAVYSYLTKIRSIKKNISPFNRALLLPMLRPCPKSKEGKMTLVLDIDETLVHASMQPRPGLRYDTVIHINNGAEFGNVYVAFRPHLHTFLRAVAPLFEVVVFTASQQCYADPLMNTIDPDTKIVTDRLYRPHCVEAQGGRIKDLNLCGRSLDRMVIIDNSPIAYCFQPRNAIPILSWFDDPNDDELLKLIPLLQQLATEVTVYPLLDLYNAHLLSRG
jgi:Dullard-like phosphatase family protein